MFGLRTGWAYVGRLNPRPFHDAWKAQWNEVRAGVVSGSKSCVEGGPNTVLRREEVKPCPHAAPLSPHFPRPYSGEHVPQSSPNGSALHNSPLLGQGSMEWSGGPTGSKHQELVLVESAALHYAAFW